MLTTYLLIVPDIGVRRITPWSELYYKLVTDRRYRHVNKYVKTRFGDLTVVVCV